MKILFVYTIGYAQSLSPNGALIDIRCMPFGISYISSFLKSHGHDTRLVVMTKRSNLSSLDQEIKVYSPGLICFTSVASEFPFVENLGLNVKTRYPDIFLLIGGVHVSLNGDESILKVFDALCFGEGEKATLELAERLQQGLAPEGIANLWIKRPDGIEKNPVRPFIADIDALPFPDRGLWKGWIEEKKSTRTPAILLGRGCPFECSYCCNHSLKKLARGRYVRFRSPENILAEIEDVLRHYPLTKDIYFEVETFGANLKWSLELCTALTKSNAARSAPLSFGVNIRITPNLTLKMDALFREMKNSNFRYVNIGLESGSERMRKDILSRNYANEDIVKAVALAKKYGFQVYLYNLIGLPFETVEDFNQTVALNRICLPDFYYLSIFFPYPGTRLHTMCRENGFLPSGFLETDLERVSAGLSFPGFTKNQIQKAYIWFDYYVYRGHRPMSWLAEQITAKYAVVYKDYHPFVRFCLMVRDYLSPSQKLGTHYQEGKMIKYLLLSGTRATLNRLTDWIGSWK